MDSSEALKSGAIKTQQPSRLVKTASAFIGFALLLNEKRKKNKQKMITSGQRTTKELIAKGTVLDQKLKDKGNEFSAEAKSQIKKKLQTSKHRIHSAQNDIKSVADKSRDKALSITGVATHKDVMNNAKIGHINAVATKMVEFNENIDFQLKDQKEILSHKVDKRDLLPLAKSCDLEPLTTKKDLASLARTEDLHNVAKSEELMDLAKTRDLKALDGIPLLTEKVEQLAHKQDLSPLAKEQSIKAFQNVLSNQMDTHQSKIELLMTQLATRDDLSELTEKQVSIEKVQELTQPLATKDDVESVLKKMIQHIQHLEVQVSYLKEKVQKNVTTPSTSVTQSQAKKAPTAAPTSVTEAIDSVKLKAG